MATLSINGRKVRVDDSFRQMTPEQQSAAVEEIAAKLSIAPSPGNAAPDPAFDEALASASQKSQFAGGPVTPRDQQAPDAAAQSPDLLGATAATLGGIVNNGLPIIGPIAQNASDALLAGGGILVDQVTGNADGPSFDERRGALQERRAQLADANPVANIAGGLAGGIGAFGAASKVPVLAQSLGMTGSLPARIFNSGTSGAALAAGDAAFKDGTLEEILGSGAIGLGAGALIPAVGAGIKAAVQPVTRNVASFVRGATAPEQEAARGVGGALMRDRAVPGNVMSSADQFAAVQNEQPLLNVDRGGEVTRALMRSAANQNPEARTVIQNMAQDRFATQANRATNFMSRLMGGNIDDLARKAEINATARVVNSEAYRKAYQSPQAQAVFSKPLQELMQSPTIQRAISMVKETGADEAALQGFKPVANPFRQGSDGTWRLVRKADGSMAMPTLEFWDQVQRNVRRQVEAAKPGSEEARLLGQIREKLLGALDGQVPAFKAARTGAFEFFSAKNALDAGKKAFASPKGVDESLAAYRSMSPADQSDFATGMMAEALDAVRSTNNRANMTRTFDNDARKMLLAEALGPDRAARFDQFLRIEDQMDRIRNALGNSTTARQLVELGLVNELKTTGGQGALGGVAGFAASGGNWSTAMTIALLTAAGRQGVRFMRSGVDAKVMEQMARLLASGRAQDMELALTLASQDAAHAAAMEAIDNGLGVVARGALQSAASQ